MPLKASQNLRNASRSSPFPRLPFSKTVFRLLATCTTHHSFSIHTSLLILYLRTPPQYLLRPLHNAFEKFSWPCRASSAFEQYGGLPDCRASQYCLLHTLCMMHFCSCSLPSDRCQLSDYQPELHWSCNHLWVRICVWMKRFACSVIRVSRTLSRLAS